MIFLVEFYVKEQKSLLVEKNFKAGASMADPELLNFVQIVRQKNSRIYTQGCFR